MWMGGMCIWTGRWRMREELGLCVGVRAGDAAGFKAGDSDGHCLQNRSAADVLVLEIGTRDADDAGHYSDIDMMAPRGGTPSLYTRRDGTPYENIRRRGPAD